MGRAVRGDDFIDLAAAQGTVNRTLRRIGSYLRELGPDERKDTLRKVSLLLTKSRHVQSTFIDWINEEI